jgi:hypothetical protein
LKFKTVFLKGAITHAVQWIDGEKMNKKKFEHSFSIEMTSKRSLTHISLSDENGDGVLIKGKLGELIECCLQEGALLEVKGANGVLRLDLTQEEFNKAFITRKQGEST